MGLAVGFGPGVSWGMVEAVPEAESGEDGVILVHPVVRLGKTARTANRKGGM